jgi:hypothetical protein
MTREDGLLLLIMKRVFLSLLIATTALSSFAQLNGDGYYRVQNVAQERYISLVDNRGSINISTTSADMGALRTILGFERVVSDPGSVIYIQSKGSGYDLTAQGTSCYSIIGHLLQISKARTGYYAYASSSGLTKYLADELLSVFSEGDELIYGHVVSNSNTTREWYIKPVTATGDCYFGITPDVVAGGSNYKSFYASFPFTFNSTGMNAYYVSKVDASKSAVVVKEITGGVPASTPVIIKCSSSQPASNKLNIGAAVSGSASGNQLKGVYFCNDVKDAGHRNVVEYDPATMRVLGQAADGSLAFVKSTTLKCIPANSAYISVTSTSPDVLKVYTQAEYDALPAGVKGDLNDDGTVDVQDLGLVVKMILGTMAKTSAADINGDGDVDVQDLGAIVKIILN